MKLCVGNKRLLVNIKGKVYHVQLNKITDTVGLFSADKCILKDKNGTYLLPKEVNS